MNEINIQTKGNMVIIEFKLPSGGFERQQGEKMALVLNKLDLLEKIKC
jgi:hypothetical protein